MKLKSEGELIVKKYYGESFTLEKVNRERKNENTLLFSPKEFLIIITLLKKKYEIDVTYSRGEKGLYTIYKIVGKKNT